jgi:hypothetical protein
MNFIVQFFKDIFDKSNDPVYNCEVYRDKENGSCAHVDGPLCDFPDCSLRKQYLEEKRNGNTTGL